MRDSVRSASYSSVCNVLRQWNIPLIPTYRVYRLYDTVILTENVLYIKNENFVRKIILTLIQNHKSLTCTVIIIYYI